MAELSEGEATGVASTIKDLHMELIFMYHRICLRLAAIGPGKLSISVICIEN